jgi:hypothetical protein
MRLERGCSARRLLTLVWPDQNVVALSAPAYREVT